ncbi:MAG: hypothetical protein ACE1ZG_00110 [Gammaproteobacteria bacterium]
MDLGIPLWGVAEVQKMQDAYTDVGGRVMQEQLPSNFLPVQPVHRHSCAVATDSCPLATLIRVLYIVLAAAARPPWMAEVSKMQEQFSTTVRPVHKKGES